MAESLETMEAKRRLGIEKNEDDKIESFKVNHLKLGTGIYVSRKDRTANGDVITTFDIRVCRPYAARPMDSAAVHTIEHIGATYLRTKSELKNDVIYFGPMGCLTGFYLILKGDLTPKDIWDEVVRLFREVYYSTAIPGASKIECGNYEFHNLHKAQEIADLYLRDTLYRGPLAENTEYEN
jgi:S-ribosylhomocysteine lyase